MKIKSHSNSIEKLIQNIIPKNIQLHKGTNIKFLAGSSISFFINYLFELFKSDIVVITDSNSVPDDIYIDLANFISYDSVSIVKEPRYSFKSKIENQLDSLDWLIESLFKLKDNKKSILVAEPNIFEYDLPDPTLINENKLLIEKNKEYDFETFVKKLMLNGFERKDYVAYQGEISIRGGIVDVFPIGWNNPIRFDFWDDKIESIREFDSLSQRSIKEHNQIEFISTLFNHKDKFKFLDYINQDTLFIFIGDLQDESLIQSFGEKNLRYISINSLHNAQILFNSTQQSNYQSSIKIAFDEIYKYYLNGFKIFMSADSHIHLERLMDIFYKTMVEKSNVENVDNIDYESFINDINWLDIPVSNGFVWDEPKILLFTEHQLFNRNKVKVSNKNKNSKALTLRELQDLKIGDYIVHEDKGIGLFDGFKTVEISGNIQDCVKLKFAEGDILYVNINYINKISKYSAQEGSSPTLSKLGSSDWLRKKARTKSKLKDIARDLIKLYAKRKSMKGFAFPDDDVMQKEFEAAFIYEDTPDQAKTTDEIKNDMENAVPMDRLVCGDVGFGKTEVAIRAAFKAVQSGKQVAVLVPTTILAQQHYMSFIDRFAKFPVIIDVISRFRTKKEQDTIVEKVQNGRIDILIGTHRILSKDIIFKDLGLLVIDEEHRFGVAAKEKLRQMRENIDTLTLTATPIPRTLNFSMMGARDLSIMETPPRNRLPVITEIMEWNDERVVEAIEFEVNRGGQVFFVSDKINDLHIISNQLHNLLPDYKIAVAHGQMPSNELEKIMEGFIENKFQILLATKIIESGIDIPNANTIIINRAQNFGLAELYQLRGRVGRTNIQAFCYLLIPETYKINNQAIRRLQAIEEFTELGSGFQLSLRDLEIRGAGNLLGAEQSGFIVDIGFELFQKILEEAVQELKYDEFSDIFDLKIENKLKFNNDDINIEIDRDALFPNDYIKNDTDRFGFYKKLYKTENNIELNEIIKELEDRYGKLPELAQNLIYVIKLRIATFGTGFRRITVRNKILTCEFPSIDNKNFYDEVFPQIIDFISSLENAKFIQNKDILQLKFELTTNDDAFEYLWKIKKIIELL